MSRKLSSTTNPLEKIAPKLGGVIRPSVGLAAKDVNFYKTMDRDVKEQADLASGEILKMAQSLVKSINGNDLPKNSDVDLAKLVGNVLDDLIEKTDIAIDDFGKNKTYDQKKEVEKEDDSAYTYLDPTNGKTKQPSTHNIAKPQDTFNFNIDNSESSPFKPLLTYKPHALKPLDVKLVAPEYVFSEQSQRDILVTPQHYEHPYAYEIQNQEYPEFILRKSVPIEFKPWNNTTAIWVDTPEELRKMVEAAKKEEVIAIDLEHHDLRTYIGLTSLIQLSTRTQDWLIDPFPLWKELHILNEVTADPMIVKVFHGAAMDIHWLQRDFGVYVVSLFDTYHASVALSFPQKGLSYLLERFAKFRTSKAYQMADWRLRPLTDIMKEYARSDTHFLLYIFDVLKNMLLEVGKMQEVLSNSRKVALRRYEYPEYKALELRQSNGFSYDTALYQRERPWISYMHRFNVPMAKEEVFKALFEWRKQVARESDDSIHHVAQTSTLAQLAFNPPTNVTELRKNITKFPESFRGREEELVELIQDAVKRSDEDDLAKLSSVEFEEMPEANYPSANTVDLKDEKQIQSEFLRLAAKLKKEGNSVVGGSSKILGPEEPVFAIEYPKKGKVVTTLKDDLVRRKEFLSTKLNEELEVIVEQVAPQEEAPLDPAEEPSAPEPEQKFSDPLTATTAAEKDEIVTLRNKRQVVYKERKQVEAEAVDYTSFDKVIKEKERTKRGKRDAKPKPIFDPYSAESEGPKAPKKKERFIGGRSSTYKSK